jgi:hypothetical protein
MKEKKELHQYYMDLNPCESLQFVNMFNKLHYACCLFSFSFLNKKNFISNQKDYAFIYFDFRCVGL